VSRESRLFGRLVLHYVVRQLLDFGLHFRWTFEIRERDGCGQNYVEFFSTAEKDVPSLKSQWGPSPICTVWRAKAQSLVLGKSMPTLTSRWARWATISFWIQKARFRFDSSDEGAGSFFSYWWLNAQLYIAAAIVMQIVRGRRRIMKPYDRARRCWERIKDEDSQAAGWANFYRRRKRRLARACTLPEAEGR
jgi:hypothetical protein